MTTRTAMAFDSVTKMAIAALALRLVERGALRARRSHPPLVSGLARRPAGDGARPAGPYLGGRRPDAGARRGDPAPSTGRPRAALRGGVTQARSTHERSRVLEHGLRDRGADPRARLRRAARGRHAARAVRPSGRRGPRAAARRASTRATCARVLVPRRRGRADRRLGRQPVRPERDAAAELTVAAGALAGDVPSLARWAHGLLGGRILAPRSLRGDDAVPSGRVLARLRPRAREELRRGRRPLGPRGRRARHPHRPLARPARAHHGRDELERRRARR